MPVFVPYLPPHLATLLKTSEDSFYQANVRTKITAPEEREGDASVQVVGSSQSLEMSGAAWLSADTFL